MLNPFAQLFQHCWGHACTLRMVYKVSWVVSYASAITGQKNVGSFWHKSFTGFKLCATTSDNMQQGVQTDATCNIQQCLELLANNLASVCTQPKMACYNFQKIKDNHFEKKKKKKKYIYIYIYIGSLCYDFSVVKCSIR